jgi:tripartite-type tricarboxylate transporter receptor subunit TctC
MMLRNLAIAAYLLFVSGSAWGEDWPARPVRLIVPYPAGGGTDIIARVLGQKLGDTLAQTFIVENKSGASGMIGAQAVAKGNPDGYTFLIATSAEIALDQHLFTEMAYDPLTDLTPVTLLAWTPLVLAAHPSLQASTASELIEFARSQPLDFSTAGFGSAHHLVGEYINKLGSTHLVHVPYRGAAPAVSDAVSGHVKLTIAGMPPVLQLLRSGQLKALAVTSKQRSPAFPSVPALAETKGFEDFDLPLWFGLLARSGTPQPILESLAKAAAAALQDPKVREVLQTQAAVPVGNTPAEFGDFIRSESAKYARIVKLTGVKAK